LTIIIDDAGSGDLLWGMIIGAYKPETDLFTYDLIPVEFFQEPSYHDKVYFKEAALIALQLVSRLNLGEKEKIQICQGNILDEAAKILTEQYGEDRVERIRVEGKTQQLVEQAYIDELRNLGYMTLPERTEKWGKSFWHMFEWVKENPKRIQWTKSAFPNLQRYKLFRQPDLENDASQENKNPSKKQIKRTHDTRKAVKAKNTNSSSH